MPDRTLTITASAPSFRRARDAKAIPIVGSSILCAFGVVEKETPTAHPSGIATGEVYCGCGEGVLGERGLGSYGVPIAHEVVAVGKQAVSTELSC